jgi:hypothetical protein
MHALLKENVMFFFCHVILNDEEKNKRRFTNRTSNIYYTTLFLNQPAFFSLSVYDRGERLLDQTKRAIIYSRENIMYRHLLFMIYLLFLLKQNDLVLF